MAHRICDACEKVVAAVGVCNWNKKPHCKTCCNDKCEPDWRKSDSDWCSNCGAELASSEGKSYPSCHACS